MVKKDRQVDISYRNIIITGIPINSVYREASLRLSACLKTAMVEQTLLSPLASEALLGVANRCEKYDRLPKLSAEVVEKAMLGSFF